MSSALLPPTFPDDEKFDGTNYFTFVDRVLIIAQNCGAHGYLNGTIQKPSPSTEEKPPSEPTTWSSLSPSAKEWEIRDAWALGLVVYNTKNPVGMGLRLGGTAAEAWAVLKTTYGTPSDLAANAADAAL
ncbi:hypothetical protein C0991_002812 [Blastosporella zonata]|nr:hypothetical protein C0991_002812 [Blastosporella zonata]